ncbi:MAG: phosphate ABC transporter ATP-binding protein PstB [bacterium JZ-2024 1]
MRVEKGKPPEVAVESLNAWYGKQQALKNVSLTAPAGAITAIIGPSGCGKSTLIRCINRLHEVLPTARVSGSVRVGNWNIYAPDVDPVLVRQKVGMVFQKPNPFPMMSIFDNVASGLRLNHRLPRREISQKVEESLRKAALWDEVKDMLHKSGSALSGGQQQRLCIARALAVEPEVLLFDEPTSALDPIATGKIEELLRELKKNYTIIIVTHNMQQAARVSDFTAFLWLGELVEFQDTPTFFTRPAQKITEDYITGRFG